MKQVDANQETFHLKRRVEALKGLINDQFYTMIQFCQTLPMGGEELMEELLRAFAIYHTRASLKSPLFLGSHELPGHKLSAIEAIESVFDIHVKEKIVEKEMARIEGDNDQFTVYFHAESCFYKGHCDDLVCDGLSCICVRRFCYEGMIQVMSNQGYSSTIDTPLLDKEFCAFTFTRQKEVSESPEKIKFQIAETIRENIRLREVSQKKLEESEKRLHLIFSSVEQAGESIVITNREGVIEYVNPAFTAFTGYSAEEAIGQTPRILKSGDQDAAFYKDIWKTIISGHVWHGKVIDRKKDGSLYPTTLTISPIYDQSGDKSCSHFVGIQSDLTRLEDMEQRFHQAQKMEAIGTLVGGIAHDFNNMLAGMAGNLYLAKQRIREMPDVVRNLDNIEDIAFRASDMIQQLLTFARKDRVTIKQLPLNAFIKETLKLLRTSVPENIDMHQEICSESLQINGDATQLYQVLLNLINNARDALEGVDNPLITTRLEAWHADETFLDHHSYAQNKPYAHLSVEDNGTGISAHQIEHLFEPFFTTKEQGKGTGLGLSMVFGAVKTHHGFVEVDSDKGKGSIFHIYLPLVEAEASIAAPPQQKEVARGHGELILLVDDEQHITGTGKDVLEALGYQVLTATTGRQAVDIFETHSDQIDLIILDIVMPVMNGDKAAQHIRRIDPHVKVIFATGYDQNLQTEMANETVLSKPFSIIVMSHLIRQQLDL